MATVDHSSKDTYNTLSQAPLHGTQPSEQSAGSVEPDPSRDDIGPLSEAASEACNIQDNSMGYMIDTYPSEPALPQHTSNGIEEERQGFRMECEGSEVVEASKHSPIPYPNISANDIPVPPIPAAQPLSRKPEQSNFLGNEEAESYRGSDNMGESLQHDQVPFISTKDTPIRTAEYPPAPPMAEDTLPGPLADRNGDPNQGREHDFDKDDGEDCDDEIEDERGLYNDVFSGADEPVPPESMFDTPQFERRQFDFTRENRESGFFDNHHMGEHTEEKKVSTVINDYALSEDDKPLLSAQSSKAAKPVDTVNGELYSGPSFFENREEGDDGDFFSSFTHNVKTQDASSSQAAIAVQMSTNEGFITSVENKSSTTVASDSFRARDGRILPNSGEEAVFFSNSDIQSSTISSNTITDKSPAESNDNPTEDLAAKWDAVLGDDLLEDGFLPDDGEGFLSADDERDEPNPPTTVTSQSIKNPIGYSTPTDGISRYSPQTQTPSAKPTYQPLQHQHGTPATYAPTMDSTYGFMPSQQSLATPFPPSQQSVYSQHQNQFAPLQQPFAATNSVGLSSPKRESFVDKKGGYHSPYDLPDDIVKKPHVSKRSNPPPVQLTMSASSVVPPARQSSLGATSVSHSSQFPFSPPSAIYGEPDSSSYVSRTASLEKPSLSALPKQSFFEDLPTPKGKPSSKFQPISLSQSGGTGVSSIVLPRAAASHQVAPHTKPLQQPIHPLPPTSQVNSRYPPVIALTNINKSAGNKYALPPVTPQFPPTSVTTLSSQQVSPPQISQHQRSSCMPSAARYQPQQVGPQMQQSPQRGATAGQNSSSDGVADGQYQRPSSIQNRSSFTEPTQMYSSRPGTAKSANFSVFGTLKEEDEPATQTSPTKSTTKPSATALPPISSRYAPGRATATPPPNSTVKGMTRAGTFSPPMRSGSPMFSPTNMSNVQYPDRTSSPEVFHPPRRAQTQSPSTAMNGPMRSGSQHQFSQPLQSAAPFVRPASAFAANHTGAMPFSPVEERNRNMSLGMMSFIPPSDTSIIDPLNRWQGCPIFTWGIGGHVAIMYPQRVQRYTTDTSLPMIKCAPGEVKIRSIKEILPLETTLAKFPGPAYNGIKSASKSKKKEILTWIIERINFMENEVPEISSELERKRAEEKILLWKGMKALLENDGVLEGSPEIEKSVRGFLWEEPLESMTTSAVSAFGMIGSTTSTENAVGAVADRIDPEAMRTIQKYLLSGNRVDAVWHAVDKRLWSHAMLIAGTVSQDLWKQVVQDFVKNEVKTLGPGMQSIAVLYEIFGGNGEESIDELVPQSARLGQPMLTTFGSNQPTNPLEGLDKWRETLALIMSNRSPTDHTAITALGKLLASFGRVEAAHLCYLFARGFINFTGPEDPTATVSLFGSDHLALSFDLPKDTDALLLTEIYELALSLSPTPAQAPIIPHLQAYKLYHAIILAENGYRTEAQKYCEAIAAVLKSSTKPSPYFHRSLFDTLEELTARLSQSPKDSGSGWLSKLSQDNLSGSMWGAFSKFVAGEDNDSTASGMTRDSGLDVGPVSKISSSPGVSRTQSSADLYSVYSGYNPQTSSYNPNHAGYNTNSAPSNYSPYTPRTSMDQTRPGTNSSYAQGTYQYAYDPLASPATSGKQQGFNMTSPYMAQSANYDSMGSFESPKQPPLNRSNTAAVYEPPTSGGYEPPSGSSGYEPPSADSTYNSEDAAQDKDHKKEDKSQPKKKAFMDDEDEDAEFLAKAAALKKEEEKKKEQEETATSTKKSGWFSGWFGKKNQSNGPIVAKLGEDNSFYYDPDLKKWVNKKGGADAVNQTTGTPPPPRRSTPAPTNAEAARPSTSHSSPFAGPPAPPKSASVPPQRASSIPPPRPQSNLSSEVLSAVTPDIPIPSPGTNSLDGGSAPYRVESPALQPPASAPPSSDSAVAPPPIAAAGLLRAKTVATSAPPTRPGTSTAGGDLIDDLLGPPGQARKTGSGTRRKGGKSRYVDVMGKS